MEKQVDEFNRTPVEIDLSGGTSEDENMSLTMTVSKSWDESKEHNTIIGAQYDGVICNTSRYPLKDWTLTIYLPRSGVVDSLWNGDYIEENNTIVITPLDYNNLIEAGGVQTFGFVFKSGAVLKLDHYQLTGYFQMCLEIAYHMVDMIHEGVVHVPA